jgi:hypothetical protein
MGVAAGIPRAAARDPGHCSGPDRGVGMRNDTCCNQDYRLRIFSFDGSSLSTARYALLVDKSF